MKKLILLSAIALLILATTSCNKEEILPEYQAKGKVLFKTGPCEGFGVYIEVEAPQGIGGSGSFRSVYNSQKRWNYENAIGVPWFNKIELPEELMEEGTWLHFEYRELDYSTADSTLFFYDGFCLWDNIPPSNIPYYTITKIISSKSKK